ncbi:protoporphyrinogen/coproporphyrinogen oxidase [Zafaria sp. Z1313]|uniref:protoporphyrinogen/coproporphyrinogen oxidase n=1 Tax=unclassified Zafaria TaxID=2828765 RepID=UPI002E76AE15|nr:FAD-dependent oxidoreductase [Zafaria sp. J156]MEE1620368.1 FAD-dependent oxidoreductase [Zafaria sp. J156]
MPHRHHAAHGRHGEAAPDGTERAAPRRAAVVVGGGIAGLVAARELAIAGYAVELFEATEAFGGCVASHTVDGLVLDAGAESFATRNTAVAELLDELGLGGDVVAPRPGGAWLYSKGHGGRAAAHPLPQTGILGIPGDPRAEDVKAVIGSAASLRAAADLAMPVPRHFEEGSLSLGELVRARMGSAVLEGLVAPVVSGVHSADPDTLDADAVAPGLRSGVVRHGSLARAVAAVRQAAPAGSAVAGLAGGMHRLSTALVAELTERGAALHTGLRAVAIEPAGPADGPAPDADRAPADPEADSAAQPVQDDAGAAPGQAPSWNVVLAGADGAPRTAAAHRVVIATTGPAAVDLLTPLDQELAAHRPGDGAGVALVTLVVDRPELDDAPRGTGLLVAADAPGVRAKALTHASAKWDWLHDEAGPGTHVLRLSYGRVSDGPGPAGSDEELFHAAVSDASALLGTELAEADVLGWDVIRWDAALPFATTGHRSRVDAFRAAVEALEDIDVVGAWLSGTGLAAVVADTRSRLAISAS